MSLSVADERLRRALALFRELVDLDPAQRAAALAQRCADDADLCAEVERLCAADAAEAALDRGAQALPAAHGEDPRLGRAIGPYRLDAVLGEGGMGTVFRATRVSGGFAQQVALKLIRGGFDGQLARQRFERERTILARLAHPDLVPLLDGGVAEDGAPWYAMPLIEGLPVTQWCDARRLTLRERLALAARLCDAVQVAHQALIVHRDLKPSNILVDERGAPHLLDFGIAKLLDDADPAAETATRLMTPAYAAPEQIRGEAVSTATDVFALGVILYELACGRHPFGGEQQSAFALQRAVIDSDPHRLSAALGEASADAALRAQQRQSTRARLRRELQGDLNRIAQKALAKRPQDRYGSAAALGDDLRRWLAGEPVQATPTSLGYRARKFLGRWRWTLAGAAVVLLSLLAATAISVQQARIAREAQRAAEANAQSAEAAQRFLQGVFLAAQPWSSDGAPPDALQLADRAFETLEQELAGQAQARADLYHSLSRLYSTFGSTTRARQAAERAAALYQDLPATSARRFEVLMQQAYAQGYDGELDTCLRSVAQAASLPGLGARERFVVATALAQGERERGRYDRALEQLQQASALADALPSREETSFALGNAERMLRRHADAARDFLRQDRDRDNSASRGWRALMAIYRFDLLPEAQRRAQDLQLAADLEAERAAVWPGGTWRELFTALRARLHLQHGDVDGALALARGLPLTERAPDRDVGGYDAEFWLSLSFILLNHDAQERGRAAQQFERIARALQRYSAAQDPRPLLARVGAACARGAALEPGLQAALAQPPQPDYLGYAWLRDAPCPALRDSAAARHPDPQARAHGVELRAALDQAAARLGECQRGLRVAVGAPCAATAP